MEGISAIAPFLEEIAKLGGWGALVGLLISRVLVTKKERDDAIRAVEDRVNDKDAQIVVLAKAVADGDAALERLAVAWEAAIALIVRQREPK